MSAAVENPKEQGAVGEFNLPEWETTARHRGEKQQTAAGESFKARALGHFNRVMPPHRRYCGLSRNTACIVFLAIFLALLILIIGLAAGLSHRSKYISCTDLFEEMFADSDIHSNHQSLPLGSQTYTGDLTYYGPGLGACGVTSSDSDNIVSVSHIIFDAASTGSNPNANPLCGHKIRAIRDGNSLDLTVVDRCESQVLGIF